MIFISVKCEDYTTGVHTKEESIRIQYNTIQYSFIFTHVRTHDKGAQWLSGRVLDSRPKGRGFEPHRRHCVVVLEQDTFILA